MTRRLQPCETGGGDFQLAHMGDSTQRGKAVPPTSESTDADQNGLAGNFQLRAAAIQLYRLCDNLTEPLIYFALVFSPWAFGTTQPWSIWTMNVAGFALGILLLLKLFIREVKGFPAPRWENFSAHSGTNLRRRHPLARFFMRALAGLTLAVLAYCLASALNAAAVFNSGTRLFEYRHHIGWLPHSMDGHRSWFYFWTYLGLAGSFWAVWDWLLGMTAGEERALRVGTEKIKQLPPSRLSRLLWLLCINGALLGLEAIIQRASGSNKLLFVMQTHENREAVDQFGPYAYRSNAAQYFNLLWPVCLGFWWTLQRAGGTRFKSHHALLFCVAIMAACPVISAGRCAVNEVSLTKVVGTATSLTKSVMSGLKATPPMVNSTAP